ncbi:hypothetical protein [Natrinema limicola]|uniref:hypothetical protein n=1 Tax=Natrinema limicola TaxID=370323 RepID=UPI000A6702E8|nr:hypothetical protein [Natrinema limicola]
MMGSQHPATMRDSDPDDAEMNKPGVTDTAGQDGSSLDRTHDAVADGDGRRDAIA